MANKKTKYAGSSSAFKFAVSAGLQVAGGLVNGVTGLVQGINSRANARSYEKEAKGYLDNYKNEVYTNPYEGMANVYDNMTINKEASEFQRDTFAQSQANTLDSLKNANMGGAGAAALAQAMASTGMANARQASLSIAGQETSAQRSQLAEQSRLQDLNIAGEQQVLGLERQRNADLYSLNSGLAAQEYNAAAGSYKQMMGGIGNVLGGVGSEMVPGGALEDWGKKIGITSK